MHLSEYAEDKKLYRKPEKVDDLVEKVLIIENKRKHT